MTDAEKAAWRAGAEAMREAAAQAVGCPCNPGPAYNYRNCLPCCAIDVRALPLPEPPEETTWVPIPFDGRQPLLSDGIYSAIRVDEYGNYEGIPLTQPPSSKETTP